jgi:protein-tyrosine-phosphatase
MNILFVCTGNTCRSPMAEGLFKDMLKKNNIDNIRVSSAGISVFPGEQANEKAIKALKEKGIDIRSHRARQAIEEIDKADLIWAMA